MRSHRGIVALAFATCLALPAGASAAAAGSLALDDARSTLPIAVHAVALPDPNGDLDIAQVVRRDGDFRDPQSFDLNGTLLHPKIYWLRFALSRATSRQMWALVIHSDVGGVDWYARRTDGSFEHVRGGLDFSRSDDAVVHRALVLPNAAYGATNYLRVIGGGGPGSLELVSVVSAAHNVLERNTLHVFFMGYFVAICGLYLLLFAILRQRSLLQYSAVMASLTALLYVDSSAAYDHLPEMSLVGRQIVHDVLIYTYFTLLAIFTIAFLRLLQRDRFAFALIVVTAALNGIGLVADFVQLPGWFEYVDDPITIAFFGALFVAGVRAWRSGMRPALFYALAILMVLIGYAVNSVVSANPALFAGVPGFVIYAFEAAIALEALLLGIAVTERIRETAREYERLLVASRELEDIALHDALTGALNRRAFDRGLADAWHTGASRRERLGLLMIDVDFFKRYNDRYGHQAGDDCLRRVAQACARCVRGGDLFVRYGGEEFAAIVPNATMNDLESIARRMREAVAELAIEHETPAGRVTISIGGAAKYASDIRSEQGLIALADAALYRAKEEGRDRAVFDRDASAA